MQPRDTLRVKNASFDLCVLRHGLHNLLFCSKEIQYFLGTFRVVPFGKHSCGAAAGISCFLLFSVLQSFCFVDKRTLEEVFLRLFRSSSVSNLPQILETLLLAPASVIRRQAAESEIL